MSEEKVFNVGDIVLFNPNISGFKNNIGMILKRKENGKYAVLTTHNYVYRNVSWQNISILSEAHRIREEIFNYFEEQIIELEQQLRNPTQEEKQEEKTQKYMNIKEQIISTSKSLIEAEDDTDFENKLKEICKLKKALFNIRLACADEIRKENGEIKFKIKELKNKRLAELNKISKENISLAFCFE